MNFQSAFTKQGLDARGEARLRNSPRGPRPPVVDQNDLCRHYSHSTENIENGRSILCAADNKLAVFIIPESRPFKKASYVIDYVRIRDTEAKPLQMYNLEQRRKISVIDPVHDSDCSRIMELTKIDTNDVSRADRMRPWLIHSVIHWVGCWKDQMLPILSFGETDEVLVRPAEPVSSCC